MKAHTSSIKKPGARLPGEVRKNKLLGSAIEVFAQKGFNSATMEDIAEKAGVTKPLLYQHFDSKKTLFLEIIERTSNDFLAELNAAIAGVGNPRQQIYNAIYATFQFVKAHRASFEIIFGTFAPLEAELLVEIKKVRSKFTSSILPFLNLNIDNYERNILANSISHAVEGAVEEYFRSKDLNSTFRKDMLAIVELLSDFIWGGLKHLNERYANEL